MIRENKLIESKRNFAVVCAIGVIVIPALYLMGILSIGDVNMLGRFMTFAILALGLDLLWGYVGILSLCQFTFFCFGAYAMGIGSILSAVWFINTLCVETLRSPFFFSTLR